MPLLAATLIASIDLAAAPSADTKDDSKASTLPQRIDQLIGAGDSKFDALASKRSSDAEFFRRITLDLLGTIPSRNDARAFLSDSDKGSNKRTRLIDRLLAHPRHARRMQYVFDSMLMERNASSNIPPKSWQQYLRESFLKNKPWDQLVLEILTADGADSRLRPAARFYLDRNFEVDLVTRDIGRVFLGVDLECAQCHDHPVVDDYLQRHYYGISAFLKRSVVFRDPKTKKMSLGEKAEGDVTFTSVFTQQSAKTDPRILDLPAIADPKWATKAYIVPPKKNVRSVPSYSRRQRLGWAMTAAENMAFSRNIVNRLWAVMMGRGLVEPLDMRHAENPASHPELLDLLADEFLKHKYDIRWLLRELALTEAYQRSSMPAVSANPQAVQKYAIGLLKPLTPEQFAWSMMEATGVTQRTMVKLEAELLKSDPKFGRGRKEHPLWREEALHNALKDNVAQFVQRFASQGGQKTTFDATANQALFLLNGSLLRDWLVPSDKNLTARLGELQDPRELAEELYVSVLTRRPSQQEVQEVTEYLANGKDQGSAVQELVWALLSSAEFRFNH